jgi:hypothetical protein
MLAFSSFSAFKSSTMTTGMGGMEVYYCLDFFAKSVITNPRPPWIPQNHSAVIVSSDKEHYLLRSPGVFVPAATFFLCIDVTVL